MTQEFDAGHIDIALSFMAIRRTTTISGNRPTDEASRTELARQRCTRCLTNRYRANPPMPAILRRFSNE